MKVLSSLNSDQYMKEEGEQTDKSHGGEQQKFPIKNDNFCTFISRT